MDLHYEDDRVEIHRTVVGPIDNNVFVLRCKATGGALLVDAADEPEQLLAACRELGVRQIIETHGHWDHIGAIPALREAGFSVGVAAGDADMLSGYDRIIADDEVIEVGEVKVRAIHTPGHTPGSTCYLVEGSPVLFSGDTLFPGGPGATGRPGSDFSTIIESIDHRLLQVLSPETIVMPGHGADTTIGEELPHLAEWVARGW